MFRCFSPKDIGMRISRLSLIPLRAHLPFWISRFSCTTYELGAGIAVTKAKRLPAVAKKESFMVKERWGLRCGREQKERTECGGDKMEYMLATNEWHTNLGISLP